MWLEESQVIGARFLYVKTRNDLALSKHKQADRTSQVRPQPCLMFMEGVVKEFIALIMV